MSAQAAAPQRRLARSVLAILAGFLTVVVLSLGTDQLLHMAQVYPPWDKPMHEPGLNLLALSYRIVYTILGAYLTARLAPHSSMRHAWVLGFIGLFFGALGAIVAIPMNLGPSWYPIAIVLTALPCAWLGGKCYVKRSSGK